MNDVCIFNINPIDGRYNNLTKELSFIFSVVLIVLIHNSPPSKSSGGFKNNVKDKSLLPEGIYGLSMCVP